MPQSQTDPPHTPQGSDTNLVQWGISGLDWFWFINDFKVVADEWEQEDLWKADMFPCLIISVLLLSHPHPPPTHCLIY